MLGLVIMSYMIPGAQLERGSESEKHFIFIISILCEISDIYKYNTWKHLTLIFHICYGVLFPGPPAGHFDGSLLAVHPEYFWSDPLPEDDMDGRDWRSLRLVHNRLYVLLYGMLNCRCSCCGTSVVWWKSSFFLKQVTLGKHSLSIKLQLFFFFFWQYT